MSCSDPLVTKLDFDKEPTPGPKHYTAAEVAVEPPTPDNKDEVQVWFCCVLSPRGKAFLSSVLVHGFLLSCLVQQNALSSFDFLSKRNSIVMNPDLESILDQKLRHPELELTVHKPRDADPEIRSEGLCCRS